jgi:hypothetical protein
LKINPSGYWEVKVHDAKINSVGGGGVKSMALSSKNIVFDSGSSQVFLPMREYRDFINEVNQVKECEFDSYDNMRYCRCDTEKDQGWPTVSVYVGDDTSKFWLYLHGRDYLIKHDHRPDY